MSSQAGKRPRIAVVDTGAFVKRTNLESFGGNIWTIEDVFQEVRDQYSRQYLDAFPYEIKTRVPTPQGLRAVLSFCRKSGDSNYLSTTDIRLMALAYDFEVEAKGKAHLRTEPKVPVAYNQPIVDSNPSDANPSSDSSPIVEPVEPVVKENQNVNETNPAETDDGEGWVMKKSRRKRRGKVSQNRPRNQQTSNSLTSPSIKQEEESNQEEIKESKGEEEKEEKEKEEEKE
eukprot:CAMPEP_0201490318 /NCGR_PEP_ID=MMETSP0151_2-20130828/26189_1 /ASSEMBLY_ACC=CAM_ASM_000257 /TAXON_ID=200890 /ORGANISM="Paramoeba atlantica, Strain 621/1 / CCAP 1560/9" /LENGTH=229 /DNA_ID=CAMNT_0047876245 /DNA_START=50 /DNA_END=736 /DNA_ORIENTATION=-